MISAGQAVSEIRRIADRATFVMNHLQDVFFLRRFITT